MAKKAPVLVLKLANGQRASLKPNKVTRKNSSEILFKDGSGNYISHGPSPGYPGMRVLKVKLNTGQEVALGNRPPLIMLTPPIGTYFNNQEFTLTMDEDGEIYYTLDGSEPSRSNGTFYTGPFTLTSSCTLKAIAYDLYGYHSPILTGDIAINIAPMTPWQTAASPNNSNPCFGSIPSDFHTYMSGSAYPGGACVPGIPYQQFAFSWMDFCPACGSILTLQLWNTNGIPDDIKCSNCTTDYCPVTGFSKECADSGGGNACTGGGIPNAASCDYGPGCGYRLTPADQQDIPQLIIFIEQQEKQYNDVQGVCSDAYCFEQLGYGDCWADAEWLYNKLQGIGVPARIMGYVGGGYGDWWRHTWVQYDIGNGWQDWPYTSYGSQHHGDGLGAASYVLIGPGNAPANILSTGY